MLNDDIEVVHQCQVLAMGIKLRRTKKLKETDSNGQLIS